MAEVSTSLVTFQYSEDISDPITDWKTIVCEDTSEGGGDSNTTETKTKCGTFTAVDTPTLTVTGSGVVKADPDSDEASFQEILNLLNTKTLVSGWYQNEVDGAVGAGAAVYMKGQGRFTSARVTATEGDLLKFNWAFAFSGEVDTVPGS
jgi:hypothetical protein